MRAHLVPFVLVALVIAACEANRSVHVQYPGGDDLRFSIGSDQYTLQNLDADTDTDLERWGENHVLLLVGPSVPPRDATVLVYGRHIDVFLSPDHRRLAITDHYASNTCTVRVHSITDNTVLDVEDAIRRAFTGRDVVLTCGHIYFEVVQWTDNDTLAIKVHGYNGPNGEHGESWYVYDVKTGCVDRDERR